MGDLVVAGSDHHDHDLPAWGGIHRITATAGAVDPPDSADESLQLPDSPRTRPPRPYAVASRPIHAGIPEKVTFDVSFPP